MQITNEHNIDLALAVWLMQDGYNSGAAEAPPGELISVTSLLKPVKQMILQRKVDRDMETLDIAELIASRMGHAIHDSVERSWTSGEWRNSLKKLGYPKNIIDKVVVNPEPGVDLTGKIPVVLEKRGFKVFEDIVLTGQMDFAISGSYRDFKSTSTFSFTSGGKDDDYIKQGSLYRYIMPEIIQKDTMRILFVFTDWQKYRAKQDPSYPQARVTHKEYPLMSIEDTEKWLSGRLADIRRNAKLPQDSMDRCSDKELWRSDPEFKYYTDPKKADLANRCTRNFKNEADAIKHVADKQKGVYIMKPGEVKACLYCPAYAICNQRKEYFPDD